MWQCYQEQRSFQREMLYQLAELELAYPTYTAIVGLAARRLVHDLGVMPLAPQWRALGKGHAAEWERSEQRNEQ